VDRLHDRLDLADGPGVEVRGRLVEEQHLGLEHPRAREREALLLAAGEDARGPARVRGQPDAAQRGDRAGFALVVRHAHDGERERQVAEHAAPQQDGALEHHRLPARLARTLAMRPQHASRGRGEQAMADAHQHALAGTVRPEDHRPRTRLEHQIDAGQDVASTGREADAFEHERQHRGAGLTHDGAARVP